MSWYKWKLYTCRNSHREQLRKIQRPEDLIVDEFFSTVPGENFDMCIISTRTKTHYNPLEKFNINIGVPLPNSSPSGLRYQISHRL